MVTMQFRHEIKHEISAADRMVLRQRLRAVLKPDQHAINGVYEIRSLYFDSPEDKALREKINGVNIREKFRIRMYNKDTNFIRLERKYKHGGLGYKESAVLSKEQVEKIVNGDVDWMADSEDAVIQGFYARIRQEGLEPKVIVDYTREPFVFPAGNVRVTLDYNLRTGLRCTDFLNPDCVTVPVRDAADILEVKWDNFLPDIVKAVVQQENRHAAAYSKYAACRMYD